MDSPVCGQCVVRVGASQVSPGELAGQESPLHVVLQVRRGGWAEVEQGTAEWAGGEARWVVASAGHRAAGQH